MDSSHPRRDSVCSKPSGETQARAAHWKVGDAIPGQCTELDYRGDEGEKLALELCGWSAHDHVSTRV